MKTKYFKTTQGLEAMVFVANGVSYTSQATYDLFVANAAEGEIGVFYVYKNSGPTTYKESAAALVPADTALTANDKFFIAQKRDGLINRTPTYTYSEITPRQVAYSAATLQQSNVGYNGSSGSLNVGTLTTGAIFSLKLIETTPGNQPFPTWQYEEVVKSSDTLPIICSRLRTQINDTLAAQNQYNGRLASCDLLTDGTTTAITVGSGNVGVTQGSTTVTATGHNVVAGDFIRFLGAAATNPVYRVKSVSTNSFELYTPYTGATNAAVTAANTLKITSITTCGFQFTALLADTHFKIAVQEALVNADVVYTTPFKEGVGTGDKVAEAEIEGAIYAGWTTLNAQFVADYGQPTLFANASSNYYSIYLDYKRTEKSVAAPKVQDQHYGNIIIFAPTGSSPATALDGIFV